MSGVRAAFHRREDELFVPTGLGVSPWNKHSQSGVSLAGLIADVLERTPTRAPMIVARLTIDIMGTVPMEPLTSVRRILRDGPRTQLVEAELQASGRTWVKASMLRARVGESPVTVQPLTHELPGDAPVSHNTPWMDIVRVAGSFEGTGAGAMWVRLLADAIEGEPLSPLQRAAITADFGAGAAPVVPFKSWTSANLDIGTHLSRESEGEWLLVDAHSESAGNGVGIARARLGDRNGMFGTTVQTTFLDRR